MAFLLLIVLTYCISQTVFCVGVDSDVSKIELHMPQPTAEGSDALFSFSTNYYSAELVANGNGVYPVVLTVGFDSSVLGADAIELEAYDDSGASLVMSARKVGYAGSVVLSGDMSPSKPGEIWRYRARLVYHDGRRGSWSSMQEGYGAITGTAFMKFFERYAMKPWEFTDYPDFPKALRDKWSNSEILSKIKAHSLKSLGTVTESSRYHGGSVTYTSKASGFKGNIFFTFVNFGELDTIWSNGSFNMYGVSLSGNGKRCDGVIVVSGMYPATVDCSLLQIEDDAPVGNYKLQQQNREDVELVPASANF